MSDFVRVRDKSTGLEYSVLHPDLAKVDVIDAPADDANGNPRTAGPNTSVTKTAKQKSASGSEPAKNPEEGS